MEPRPIAQQQRDRQRHQTAHIQIARRDGAEAIAKRDALQDAGNPEGRPLERRDFNRVQDEAEREQDERAANDVAPDAARRAAPARQREGDRGAHREQQKGKDEIGRRPAMPRRVIERRVDRAPRAWGADENHRRDRKAAKHVERIEPPRRRVRHHARRVKARHIDRAGQGARRRSTPVLKTLRSTSQTRRGTSS